MILGSILIIAMKQGGRMASSDEPGLDLLPPIVERGWKSSLLNQLY